MSSPDRTRVRRLPEKQARDRSALDGVLDAALVAHVAVPQAERLAVVPVGFARDGDRLLLHGSSASQAFRTLGAGVETCVTVTLLDGVVVARSQFESSMHYRSAMLFGSCTPVPDDAKEAALAALSARLLPDVVGQRTPSPKELRATAVLEMPIVEWSVKVSAGPPDDLPDDVGRPVWAGVVPLEHRYGTPQPAPDLHFDVPAPSVSGWVAR